MLGLCSAENWTQGRVCGKQVLYQLSYSAIDICWEAKGGSTIWELRI